MPSLNDLVNQSQSAMRDALAQVKERQDQAHSRREQALARAGRAGSEIAASRPGREKLRSEIQAKEEEIQNLQRRIGEIRRQLFTLRDDERHAEESTQKHRKDQEHADRDQKAAQKDSDNLEAERARVTVKFRADCRTALRTHLIACAKSLSEGRGKHEAGRAAREAAFNLEVARAKDSSVAALWDHREEARSMLATVRAQALRVKIEDERARIEKEIERRFPGALSVEANLPDSALEELLLTIAPNGDALILLPMDPAVWNALEAGRQTPGEAQAIRLVWELGRALGRSEAAPEVVRIGTPEILAVRFPGGPPEGDQVEINLDGMPCTFLIASLPKVVEEALHAQNSAS